MKVGDLVRWDFEGMPSLTATDFGVVVHVYTAHPDPACTSIDVMWDDGIYTQLAGEVERISEGR
jgi:hypothetical protein